MIAACTILLTIPVWTNLDALNRTHDRDAHQALSFYYSLVDAVRRHGEYPLWNPYLGGGIPWAGYVQNPALTPVSIPLIAFGEVAGTKWLMLSVLALGGIGMYLALRSWLALSTVPALVVALVYTGSSWIPGRIESGNYSELVYFLLPLLLATQYAFLRRSRWGLLLPFVYLTLISDAKYGVPISALAALGVALGYRRRVGLPASQVLLGWAAPFAVALALGANKILPLIHLIGMDRADPMPFPHDFFDGVRSLLDHVVIRGTQRPNFMLGIGAPALGLAAVGVVLRPRRAAGPLLAFALLAAMMLGPVSPIPVHRLLDGLPFFDSMKSLVKYWTPVALFALLALTGLGLEALWRASAHAAAVPRAMAAAAIGAIVLSPPFAFSWDAYSERFTEAPQTIERGEFHHVAHRSLLGVARRYRYSKRFRANGQYANMRRNAGTLTWYGNMVFGEHAVPKWVWSGGEWNPNPAYAGEITAGVSSPPGCSLPRMHTSYNRIWLDLGPDVCRSVVLNFEFDPGWQSGAAGASVLDVDGRLGVVMPSASSDEIRLVYHDHRFEIGLVLGGVALVGWLALGWRFTRRTARRRHSVESPI